MVGLEVFIYVPDVEQCFERKLHKHGSPAPLAVVEAKRRAGWQGYCCVGSRDCCLDVLVVLVVLDVLEVLDVPSVDSGKFSVCLQYCRS